jgi:hypothetical protein
MDVKKLGRIPDGGGWHAHGRKNTGLDVKRRNGFDYVQSLVDGTAGWPTARSCPTRKASPARDSCAGPPNTSAAASPALGQFSALRQRGS